MPALLGGLLLMMLALQLLLPRDAELPDVVGGMSPRRRMVEAAAPRPADPVIVARALFAPGRAANQAIAAGPLDGAAVVGLVRRGRSARVMIAEPDGQFTSVGIGMRYRGLRLVGAGPGAAIFTRDGERLVVPFSTGSTASTPPAHHSEEEQAEE